MSWVAAGIGAVSLGAKIFTGASQNSQANKIDKNNPYPYETVQDEYYKNEALADQMSRTGIPAQQYNNQLNSIGQNQAAALSALSRSANPAGGAAAVVRQSNNATNSLNAQDAAMRNNNLMNLMQQRMVLAQQKDKAWDWNHQQKYLSLLAKSNQLRGAANQNIAGGLNEGMGLSTMLGQMGAFKRMGMPSTTGDTSGNFGQAIPANGAFSYGAGDPTNYWGASVDDSYTGGDHG